MRVDEEKIKDEVRKVTERLTKVPTRWRGQTHGGIDYGRSSDIVVCPICTIKFDTGRPVGVRRKDQKRHMAAHKAG